MKKLLSLVLVVVLTSCGPVVSRYYYISLEGVANIEISSVGEVQLENLVGDSEVPTGYRLSRERYELSFRIGDTSYYPHFYITVENSSGMNYRLIPRRNHNVVSEKGLICGSFHFDVQKLSKMNFGWSPDCLSAELPKLISFDVVDGDGNLMGRESVPFSLKRNGMYILLDAI